MFALSQNMPRRSRPLIGRNTAASRRYRNARAIETPLQSETRRALRRLRYSEARVAATQTMQVPVQRIQLWTHKPFSGLEYNAHIDYKADSSVDIGQMSRKKPAINRSYLTKTCNKIESGLDTLMIIELEELLEQLNESFNELKLVDHEIETLLETGDLERELQGVEEYREKYITWRFRANKKIR
ncbi:hypothetical protein LAZ67_20001831 [Cordylochernes scorpioides]|uniref:Uncharacterized protein n=1 Tax=Cordylochernes scorpioides TaxID=51811 RepID=A0ABY6LKF2_9ARAC|nr:hypothetical protein LAZ67_20001831 [Cordylochernes scorpioides]